MAGSKVLRSDMTVKAFSDKFYVIKDEEPTEDAAKTEDATDTSEVTQRIPWVVTNSLNETSLNNDTAEARSLFDSKAAINQATILYDSKLTVIARSGSTSNWQDLKTQAELALVEAGFKISTDKTKKRKAKETKDEKTKKS